MGERRNFPARTAYTAGAAGLNRIARQDMGLRCHLRQIDDSIAQRLISGERPSYEAGAALDLDKAWGGIHFLLSGSTEGGNDPRRFLMSGHLLDEVSEHVAVQRASATASFDTILKQTANAALFAHGSARDESLRCLPGSWTECDGSYLAEPLGELRKFISATAASGRALVISIL